MRRETVFSAAINRTRVFDVSMFHQMKTAELRRSAEMMEARDEWLRWSWGGGGEGRGGADGMPVPTSVPHPLSIPAPCSLHTTFPAAVLEKQPVLFSGRRF